MEVSAEIRWFWQGAGPAGLQGWFNLAEFHDCAAGGGGMRTDAYLSEPQQAELGIKLRQHKSGVEIKGLVAVIANGCQDRPFLGPIEIWSKWSSEALSLGGATLIPVAKRRWLRKFDTAGPRVREIALDAQELPLKGGRLPDEAAMSSVPRSQLKDIRNGLHLGSKHLNAEHCGHKLAANRGSTFPAETTVTV